MSLADSPEVAAYPSPSPHRVAKVVDNLLAEELWSQEGSGRPAPLTDDFTFLRRAYLDIVGDLPPVKVIQEFVEDDDKDRRRKVVSRLLEDPRYGTNWARYWRDVIMYRRTEDRAIRAIPALMEELTQDLNENMAWDDLARRFLTAEGDVREDGQTAIIFAQAGNPEDTVAEMSRIFLGIQIQCAQCHDHPTDRWTRDQFHELAAFFPRTYIRPARSNGERSFVVASRDQPMRRLRRKVDRHVGEMEHYMPDLDDPAAEGELMEPIFFVNDQKLELGASDEERREALADWFTSPENPWFAVAYVNRMWSELVGSGFYEPIDDLGPDREATAPKTLEYLADQFVASDYDVKWLMKTIMGTKAYQRRARSRQPGEDVDFLANVPQRLRSDQVYSALVSVFTSNNPQLARRLKSQGRRGPRALFAIVFGFDPSELRTEVNGSVPQALVLMNGEMIDRLIQSQRRGLMRLADDTGNDDRLIERLYLSALSRKPNRTELTTARRHLAAADERYEGVEDLMWALINCSEFIHRG